MDKNCEMLLLDYAAGSLDRAHGILVASYLTLSPDARRYVGQCETLGAAMMTYLCDCAEMSAGSLESVLAKIDCGFADCESAAVLSEACIANCAKLPQPLSRAMPEKAAWQCGSGGAEWMELRFGDCPSCLRVIRCKPGVSLPCPGQTVLVLDGIVQDRDGRYGRGDLLVLTGRNAAADGETGCVIAAIMDNPGKKGFWSWLRRGFR